MLAERGASCCIVRFEHLTEIDESNPNNAKDDTTGRAAGTRLECRKRETEPDALIAVARECPLQRYLGPKGQTYVCGLVPKIV